MFSPQGEEPTTWFAIWSTRLEHAVVAEDLDLLREGVEEGLSRLPGLQIESSSDDHFDNLLRFERIYTFEEDGIVRKRRVWMTYVWKWLFTLVAQGETVEEFHYWRMMLNDFFDAFDLAPELWFASDRELAQDVS
jgi:hypothetical protein